MEKKATWEALSRKKSEDKNKWFNEAKLGVAVLHVWYNCPVISTYEKNEEAYSRK